MVLLGMVEEILYGGKFGNPHPVRSANRDLSRRAGELKYVKRS